MRAYELEAIEAKFAKELRDLDGKQFVASLGLIAGTVKIRSKAAVNYYYPEVIKKDKILLHYTVGTILSDLTVLTKPNNHVSVAYLVARSGTVYELFDPKAWAYHLGPNATGGNTVQSQRSIAIEISNLGALGISPTDPTVLIDTYKKPYCKLTDTQYYVKTDYRGSKYFASFTDAQYKAIDSLLLNLCREFKIQHSFLPPDQRFQHQLKVPQVGILSHVNFRKDKQDLSPAFDFSKISGI